jgi:hypothetical protein
MLSARLKVMLADLGLTSETAAQMLHVTPRTVRYWISGKVLVPYSAYRLLRILTGAELPANGWDGWHMHSGKLWTPEGHGFLPSDSSWWGLLVRQARTWKLMSDRHRALEAIMVRAGSGDVAPQTDALAHRRGAEAQLTPTTQEAGAAQPPRSNLLITHFRTLHYAPEKKSLSQSVNPATKLIVQYSAQIPQYGKGEV